MLLRNKLGRVLTNTYSSWRVLYSGIYNAVQSVESQPTFGETCLYQVAGFLFGLLLDSEDGGDMLRPSYPHSHTYHSGRRVYKLINDCWAPMKINFIIDNW
jgi:hypothetical protein